LELPAEELRVRVNQLVQARLPADHAVWTAVRRDPALTARVRGVLSGLLTSVRGAKDEHMQRFWIAAAKAALDRVDQPAPAPAADAEPAADAAAEAAGEPAAEPAPEPVETVTPATPEPPQVISEGRKPNVPAGQPAIPAMVFQEPGRR
jgi:hypothetical protein